MKKIFLLFPIGVLFFTSCSDNMVVNTKTYDYEKADSLPVDYLTELGNIRVSIEQVAMMNSKMKENSYSYNNSILNSANGYSKYSTSKVQAIMLGMYGADLNYAVSHNQTQDAINYIDAIINLAEKLGIKSAFNREMIEQLTSSDTTIDKSIILTRAFRHAEDNLYSQDRAQLSVLMVAGGWIESVFVATTQINAKPYNGVVNYDIWDNTFTYTNVKKMLAVFKDKYKDCNDLLVDLETLEAPINSIIQSRYQS
jgi:hypothetical protein